MEQQVENTQAQETQQVETTQEQVQSTVETTEQTQAQETVDLSKKDPSQLTPEEIADLQKGYMRQADYTRKTQELAEQRKATPDFAQMVQSQEFLGWAKQMGLLGDTVQKQSQQEEPEFMQNLDPSLRQAFEFIAQQKMQPYVQSFTQQTIQQQDEKIKGAYGEQVFTPNLQKEMNALHQDIIKNKGALYREELFKIKDYDSAVKRAYEQGRQEGLKGKQVRQQANLPQGMTQNTTESIFSPNDTKEEKLRKSMEAAEKLHGVKIDDVTGRYFQPRR